MLKRTKGFSLAETLLTVGIVGMCGGVFVFSSSKASKPKVDSLARALVSELSQARLQAIRQQSPVALVFPAGDRPVSASLYQLEGLNSPRVQRVQSFAGDFPGLVFFIGTWNASDPETRTAPIGGTKWSKLDLAKWLPDASEQDYALVFMPDGTVRSNDLPQFDGEFHIAVSDGVSGFNETSVSGGTMPTKPRLFSPTGLGETRTVCINAGGAVRMESGLLGAPALARHGRVKSTIEVAQPRTIGTVQQASGEPLGTSVLPEPVGGEPSTIPPDGFATLTTFAKDVKRSGQRLFCSWKIQAADSDASGHSAYSIPVDASSGAVMDYTQRANLGGGAVAEAYVSSWAWRPPEDAKPGDVFTMALLLQNEEKELVDVAIEKKVKVLPYGSILFETDRNGSRQLFRMRPDGTDQRRFHLAPASRREPANYEEYGAMASADGSRIVYTSERDGTPKLHVASADGSYDVELKTVSGLKSSTPCISPAGDRVAFKGSMTGAPGSWTIWTQSVAGVPRNSGSECRDGNVDTDRLCWPEGYGSDDVYFTHGSVSLELHRQHVSDGGDPVGSASVVPRPAISAYGVSAPYWSPQTGQMMFVADGAGSVGDTFIGRILMTPSGFAWEEYIYSAGWEDRTPCPIWCYGRERVLTTRHPVGGGQDQIYLLTPAATTPANPSEIQQLTHNGNNRRPTFIR